MLSGIYSAIKSWKSPVICVCHLSGNPDLKQQQIQVFFLLNRFVLVNTVLAASNGRWQHYRLTLCQTLLDQTFTCEDKNGGRTFARRGKGNGEVRQNVDQRRVSEYVDICPHKSISRLRKLVGLYWWTVLCLTVTLAGWRCSLSMVTVGCLLHTAQCSICSRRPRSTRSLCTEVCQFVLKYTNW